MRAGKLLSNSLDLSCLPCERVKITVPTSSTCLRIKLVKIHTTLTTMPGTEEMLHQLMPRTVLPQSCHVQSNRWGNCSLEKQTNLLKKWQRWGSNSNVRRASSLQCMLPLLLLKQQTCQVPEGVSSWTWGQKSRKLEPTILSHRKCPVTKLRTGKPEVKRTLDFPHQMCSSHSSHF